MYLDGGNFLSIGQTSGPLTLTSNDGILSVGAAYTMASAFTNNGSLSITGTLTTGEAFHNSGSGSVTVSGGGILNLNGAFDGNITVNAGVVDLWGIVDLDAVKQALRVDIEQEPGVRSVNNNIVVGRLFAMT